MLEKQTTPTKKAGLSACFFIQLNHLTVQGLQRVFQRFTGAEFRCFSSSNGQRRTGLRIAALTLCTLTNVESTETDQRYGVAFFQSFGHSIHQAVQSFGSDSFRDVGFLGNGFNLFRLVHNKFLSIVRKNNESPVDTGVWIQI